jgi:DNA-binding FrmR family transcriptional regulator
MGVAMSRYPKHNTILPRLKRIEGQIRGITRMVEERRYCIDIIQQLTAARKALDQASLQIMNNHINTCVSDAIRKQEGAGKINELMQTITRFVK